MICVASLSLLFFAGYAVLQIAVGGLEPPPNVDPAYAAGYKVGFFIGIAIPSIIQIVVLAGAIQMVQMKSYGGAMTASIVAMLPCSAFCILNTPFGIWGLIVLRSPGVKRAFR
jgi:hypothetical protein